jgi:MerR family transcriptional regulator, thiopeptide resistance regulator
VKEWRVGELAAATGLTVRTLRYFDEIGLLRPCARSPAGHRLYTPADVRRLHRVLTLRHLGTPLAEIAAALDGGIELADLLTRQLADVDVAIAARTALRERIADVLRALHAGDQPTVEQLIDAMEALMSDPRMSPEERASLRARHGEHGEVMQRWRHRGAELDEHARGLSGAGVDPAADAAQELGRQWAALMAEMSGGDRGLLSSIYARLDRKGAEQATGGAVSTETWSYLKRVLAVGYGS